MRSLAASQFPNRADCNPYIRLLKSSLAEWGVRSHEHEMFVDGRGLPYPQLDPLWLFRHRGQVSVLHFHWLQKFYRAASPEQAERRLAQFADFLCIAKELGYRVVYTFHNLLPHEGMGEEMDFRVRRLMIKHADLLFCFSNRQRAQLQETFGPLPLAVIPHPNYIGYYPDNLPADECRRRLGLPQEARVFCYLGLVRPYKELEALITAFDGLQAPDLHLLLAGVSLEEQLGRRIAELTQGKARIHSYLRWIEDEELQVFLKAADAVVLPYGRCWCSGAMLLAFSFGKPVISADPLMIDNPAGLGFFYAEAAGLPAALEQGGGSQELAEMGRRCLEYARSQPWSKAGRQFATAYLTACDKVSEGERPVVAVGRVA